MDVDLVVWSYAGVGKRFDVAPSADAEDLGARTAPIRRATVLSTASDRRIYLAASSALVLFRRPVWAVCCSRLTDQPATTARTRTRRQKCCCITKYRKHPISKNRMVSHNTSHLKGWTAGAVLRRQRVCTAIGKGLWHVGWRVMMILLLLLRLRWQ